MKNEFEDIRPYNSEEIQSVLGKITEEKSFMKIVSTIFPLMPKPLLKEKIKSFNNVDDFQKQMILPFVKDLEANKTKGIEIEGVEKLSSEKEYLFISNHRDIVLDASFLCTKLIENGRNTAEIAIGDNLLIFPWIKDLVRLNKSFIVKRGLTPRESLQSAIKLSNYIYYAINEKKQSAWIAQREGRAKDSDDRTQQSLLKMLSFSGKTNGNKSFINSLKALNICPVTISYEYDPCDYLKAKEFQQKRDNSNYKKSQQDDLVSMQTGILGYKGKVIYKLSECINDDLDKIAQKTDDKNEQIELVAQLIDKKIHANYEIYPINKWAYDKLNQTTKYKNELSEKDRKEVETYFERQLNKVDLENADRYFLTTKMLEMYANPLKNKLVVEKNK